MIVSSRNSRAGKKAFEKVRPRPSHQSATGPFRCSCTNFLCVREGRCSGVKRDSNRPNLSKFRSSALPSLVLYLRQIVAIIGRFRCCERKQHILCWKTPHFACVCSCQLTKILPPSSSSSPPRSGQPLVSLISDWSGERKCAAGEKVLDYSVGYI